MYKNDVTLLTDRRYLDPEEPDGYTQNVLREDLLIQRALENRDLKVHRINWDDAGFDWTSTRCALFRTTWDYFDRYAEFSAWLNCTAPLTHFVNPVEMLRWNVDKNYLTGLNNSGVRIPPTIFIEAGNDRSLPDLLNDSGWKEAILKPAISGAARHTYRITRQTVRERTSVYEELIAGESMLLQEFQRNILTKGEVALMLFGGKYSHAILKKAKPGDFRVQDDFGGTVHKYIASPQEIEFAEYAVSLCRPTPVYARVDIIWDNSDQICLSELELIEPELWMRRHPPSADAFADAFMEHILSL